DQPQYISGTRLLIGGTIGQVTTVNGVNLGSIEVQHNAGVTGLHDVLFAEPELEFKTIGNDPAGNGFQGGIEFGATITFDPITGLPIGLPPRLSGLITNDTPANAQILGAVKE